ncbi:hypothetical protein LguiA_012971 [Lonicera macranthoides]
MVSGLINANPTVYEKKERRARTGTGPGDVNEYAVEPFLHHIRDIKDPEHPYSLEELKVISEEAVEVNDENSHVRVTFTPTVEHCSMATVIGLCLRVKLMRSLPSRYKPLQREGLVISKQSVEEFKMHLCDTWHFGSNRTMEQRYAREDIRLINDTRISSIHPKIRILVDIRVAPGTHATEAAVNKQLNDKERVAAALENPNLVDMVDECLAPSYA